MGDSMSSKIKAGTTTSGAVIDADTTGILELQTGSTPTTAVTISTAQAVTFAKDAVINNVTVGHGGGNVAHNVVVANTTIPSGATGDYNNAFGWNTLSALTTGASNQAFGNAALYANTTGGNNTAIGETALFSNTTASNNTAVGYQAGYSLTTGGNNVLMGYYGGIGGAGSGLTTATANTFIGPSAGYLVTTGSKNTFLGAFSGNSGSLDIRTASNYIVLSDGDGNPRAYWNATGQATFTATSGTGLSVVNNFTGNGTPLILTQSATNAFNAMEIRNSGSTAVFIVAANGNATNTNNSYGGISDIKLKENIVDATPKLDDLMQVKVRNYNLIGNTQKQIGVVAQELEQVFAGLVEETIDIDAEGNDLGTTTKSVKYSVFVPMLIKAVQELNAKVDAQALEIQALKGNA
jgi:hypothetical protein